MKRFRPLHKLYGGMRIVQVCEDWPKWFQEYFNGPGDGSATSYKMRCGIDLNTRRNGSDIYMIDEIWAYRKYDYFGYRVAPGDIVVDIGANIGTFSTYAATVCRASRVLSFEPFPDSYRMLCKNVNENKLNNVTCVNQAVAGSRGRRTMVLDSLDPGSHSLVLNSSEAKIEVECCTLDDIFERFSLAKIDYLKMDCEGADYEIFENAKSRFRQINRISMETHTVGNRKAEDLGKLLGESGFDVRLFGGHRLYATRRS
jgi:FkbM family methyltransferase